jgi:plastocyanin
MRHARFLFVAMISAAIVGACTSESAGWTYTPAPALTPAPSSDASAEPSEPGDLNVVKISAQGIKFEQTTVTAPANTPFQIQFENKDAGVPHNVAIRLGSATGAELYQGTVFNGIETRAYDLPAYDAGQYAFVCTVHPTMIGTMNVE